MDFDEVPSAIEREETYRRRLGKVNEEIDRINADLFEHDPWEDQELWLTEEKGRLEHLWERHLTKDIEGLEDQIRRIDGTKASLQVIPEGIPYPSIWVVLLFLMVASALIFVQVQALNLRSDDIMDSIWVVFGGKATPEQENFGLGGVDQELARLSLTAASKEERPLGEVGILDLGAAYLVNDIVTTEIDSTSWLRRSETGLKLAEERTAVTLAEASKGLDDELERRLSGIDLEIGRWDETLSGVIQDLKSRIVGVWKLVIRTLGGE